MAFVLYLFVLMISVASVMFGLDLINSPLPTTPNVPIGRSVRHVASAPAAQKVDKSEQQADKHEQQIADRALSPIFPASPGPSAPLATSGAGFAEPAPAKEVARAEQSAPSAPVQQAVAQPAAAESPRCDVSACSRAYHSFSAADCTYQPLEGPRRLCEKSGVPLTTATVAAVPTPRPAPKREHAAISPPKPQQATRKNAVRDELAEVVRIVKQQRLVSSKPMALHPPQAVADAREMSEVERIVRKMTRGRNAGDIPVIDGTGRVIVVHTGDGRAQAYRE